MIVVCAVVQGFSAFCGISDSPVYSAASGKILLPVAINLSLFGSSSSSFCFAARYESHIIGRASR